MESTNGHHEPGKNSKSNIALGNFETLYRSSNPECGELERSDIISLYKKNFGQAALERIAKLDLKN